MNYVIAAVMLILLTAVAFRWAESPGWPIVFPTALAGGPIVLAAVHTVPAAKRLGSRTDDLAGQSHLARGVCRDHLLCLASMSLFLAVWVSA